MNPIEGKATKSMNIRTVIRVASVAVLFCVFTISFTWTILTVIGMSRARIRATAPPTAEIKISINKGKLLPRFDNVAILAGLGDSMLSLARSEAFKAGGDGVATINLMNASISFDAVDSTYSYRFAFISECSCPLSMSDRYTINLKYVNPLTLEVFREERHRNLSAEEVKRFDELLTFERR